MSVILIVDDCDATCQVADAFLRSLDFQTLVAFSGPHALQLCKITRPDAILLDWNMPGMDGTEFQKEIKTMFGPTGPKIIFCSVRDEYEDIAAVISEGADAFIIKPYSLETLRYNLRCTGLLSDREGG